MDLVWTLVFLGGVALTIDAIYEDVQYKKERKLEMNRRFYPLDFESADAYHIMKDTQDITALDTYNVFDSHNLLKYKISKKLKQKKLFKEEWIISDITDQTHLAFICVGSLFHKHFVQFPMINRSLSHHLGSSVFPFPLQKQTEPAVQSPLSYNDIEQIPTNYTSPGLSNSYVAPYIDSSLVQNRSITQGELGPIEVIRINDDLHRYEPRRLSKIYLRITKCSKISNFKIAKNSMLYSWRANGYLEKHSKNLLDASSERIGMVRFKDKRGDDYWIYINDKRMDPLVAVTSAFLHQKLSLWNCKKLASAQ